MHFESLSSDLAGWRNLIELAYGQAAEDDVEKIIANLKDDKASFNEYVRHGYDSYPQPATKPFLLIEPSIDSNFFPDQIKELSTFFQVPPTSPPMNKQ